MQAPVLKGSTALNFSGRRQVLPAVVELGRAGIGMIGHMPGSLQKPPFRRNP